MLRLVYFILRILFVVLSLKAKLKILTFLLFLNFFFKILKKFLWFKSIKLSHFFIFNKVMSLKNKPTSKTMLILKFSVKLKICFFDGKILKN